MGYKTLTFSSGLLNTLSQEGRLAAAQLFTGVGKTSLIVVGFYGYAGARWDQQILQKNNKAISAVFEFAATKGNLPVILSGDYNVEISECEPLKDFLAFGQWHDAAGSDLTPTCLKGKNGSRIDFFFLNPTATSLLTDYSVKPGLLKKDHQFVSINLVTLLACQHEYRLKNNSSHVDFAQPPVSRIHPVRSFRKVHFALAQNQIEEAWGMWSKIAEECLAQIPLADNSVSPTPFKPGKGKVRFRRQRVYPKQFAESATTLEIVRWSKILRQLTELQKFSYFGHRACLTWKNVQTQLAHTKTQVQHAETVRQLAKNQLSLQNVQAMSIFMPKILFAIQNEEKKARIKNWKQRMQTSKRDLHKWLKKGQDVSAGVLLNTEGQPTANKDEIFAAILHAWNGVFNKFASGSPPTQPFLDVFGPTMRTAPCQLQPLTAERLRASLRDVKQSASGLDSWNANELKALSNWYPEAYISLAALLNHIETNGVWPSALASGYTTMLPKPGGPLVPGPQDMRPISVLSQIFRLWSHTRFIDCQPWQALWIPNNAYGGLPNRSAEQLGFDVSFFLEEAASSNMFSGGIAFDFAKAFDVIPIDLMIASLRHRGAPANLLQALTGVYKQLHRVFRYQGSYSSWWTSANGIIQGCSLSLLGLNSLISCILERAQHVQHPCASFAYADDCTAVAQSSTPAGLLVQLRQFHDIVDEYQQCGLGDLNVKKTFTFGDESIRDQIRQGYNHSNDIRVVGVSVVTQNFDGTFAKLEKERLQKWQTTINNVAKLPVSWSKRAHTLLTTQAQATFGQGAHQMFTDVDELRKVRSSIMRCMWQTAYYSMSPSLTFALLLPAHLDPQFAMMYVGALAFQRAAQKRPEILSRLFPAITASEYEAVGPCTRMYELLETPLGPIIQELLDGAIHTQKQLDKWKHDLRHAWRIHLYKQVAKDRPHQYAQADLVDPDRTMHYYKLLEIRASDETLDPESVEQARMKLSVLRRLFAGGLLTESRIRKHKRRPETITCPCGLGEEDTVEHISWRCTKYQAVRAQMLNKLPQQGRRLPVITQYAALILKNSQLTQDQIDCLQETLVTIWQQHIRSFYAEDVNDTPATTPAQPSSSSQPANSTRTANGHALAMLPSGGMWCRKCGRQCARLQHIRLKITRNPCPHANKDETQWLDTPGFNLSSHRLDMLQEELEVKYNKGGHVLTWNRQIGKVYNSPTEGLIHCARCKRQWRWKDRVNNLPKTKCNPVSPTRSSHSHNSSITPTPKYFEFMVNEHQMIVSFPQIQA